MLSGDEVAVKEFWRWMVRAKSTELRRPWICRSWGGAGISNLGMGIGWLGGRRWESGEGIWEDLNLCFCI